jgi:hypothetical protein
MVASDRPIGGIKGFITKAVKSFSTGGAVAKDWTYWLAQKGGRIGLILASTSMVILLPLIFEINREVQVRLLRLHPSGSIAAASVGYDAAVVDKYRIVLTGRFLLCLLIYRSLCFSR